MSEVNVSRYLKIVWKWLWLIILATGMSAGISYRVSKSLPATYMSSTLLMVGQDTTLAQPSLDQLNTSQRLASIYAGLAQREPVLSATVQALKLPTTWNELQSRVLVIQSPGSQIIEIRVVDSNPQRAKATVDEITHQLMLNSPTAENLKQLGDRRQFVQQQLDELQSDIQQAQAARAKAQDELAKETSSRGVLDRQDEIQALDLKIANWQSSYASLLNFKETTGPNTLSVIQPPFVPSTPTSPNVRSNVMLAAALGLVLAVGAIFLVEYFDDTVDGSEDAAKSLPMPVVGSIMKIGTFRKPKRILITATDPYSPASDAYRLLRTNLLSMDSDQETMPFVITSPGSNEGKSLVSANLAVSLAQSGKSVILVDADLRHPTLHNLFGGTNQGGLVSLLVEPGTPRQPDAGATVVPGDVEDLALRLQGSLVQTDVHGLRYLPGGLATGNPAELLGSPRMARLLEAMKSSADVVILDSAPVLPIADTTILAGQRVAVVLIAQVGKTRVTALRLAHETLRIARARVVGIVLNKAPRSSLTQYRFRYPKAAATGENLQLRVVHRG